VSPGKKTSAPVWLVIAIAIGVGLLAVYDGYRDDREDPNLVSPRVTKIVEGLRTTSVYAEPGNPGKIDVEFARELIGDRPIVVAVLDDTPLPGSDEPRADPAQDLCREVADEVATSLVILFADNPEDPTPHDLHGPDDPDERYDPSFCTGPQFSNPRNPVDADEFGIGLIAEVSWQYQITDENLTPIVSEYVYAFDAKAAEVYPDGVPRRAVVPPEPPTPDKVQAGQIVLSYGGILAATAAVFLLLRLGGRAALRRRALTANTEHLRTAARARLNRLADRVLHPEPAADAESARRQAETARRYVLLLADYERADTKADLDRLERELTSLEQGAKPEEGA
jgi:hypothetical protein